MERKVSVPDMSCQHCVNRINKSLEEANVVGQAHLETRTVTFEGDESVAKQAIEDAGYTVEEAR